MSSIQFQAPPSGIKNATLYQHAKETLRFGKEVRDRMQSLDNQDGVDLNHSAGKVVTASPQSIQMTHDLKGALERRTYTSMKGQCLDGELDATLYNGNDKARVTYKETDQKIEVAVESRAQGHYHYHPGNLKVVHDKTTGAINLEQEQDFPWKLTFQSAAPARETLFAPEGPSHQNEVEFYKQGQKFQAAMEQEMSALKALDNGPQDLNPEPGLVVVAGLASQSSDNLVHGHMAGDYPVPTEGMLRFDPATGQVSEFDRGFGDHNTLAYRREGENRVYERNAFLACDRLEVRGDGSRLQQHFQEAHFVGKEELYKTEHKVTTALLPRMLDQGNRLAVAGWSAAVGTLAGLFCPGPASLAFTAGLAAAAATAGVVSLAKLPEVDLQIGVNRFAGSDEKERFATAQKAFNNFLAKRHYKPKTVEAGAEGINRERVKDLLAQSDTGYRGENLLILCQSHGDKKQPALIVVSKDFHYPVRLQQDGIELPGGDLVRYDSIRAISDSGY